MRSDQSKIPAFVRRAMEGASERELLEATERLRRYLKAMYAIFLELEEKKGGTDSEESDSHDRFQVGV